MLHAARNDDELSLLDPNMPVLQFHAEPTLYNQEKLVFVIVVVPNERPLKFDELDLLAVQLAHDLGTPVLPERTKLINKIDLFHDNAAERDASSWRNRAMVDGRKWRMEENTGVRGNERRFLLSCFRRFPELTASDKPGKLVWMTL